MTALPPPPFKIFSVNGLPTSEMLSSISFISFDEILFQVKMSGSGSETETDQGYELFDPNAKKEARAGLGFMVKYYFYKTLK